jgi:hypothetical protein
MPENPLLLTEIEQLLNGGTAHAHLEDALHDLPAEHRGLKPHNLPYSIWQLVEHIRIAQWDMLEFCKNANHQSPKWPDEYWPDEAAPATPKMWDQSLAQIKSDLQEMISLVKSGNLYEILPHGTGQNLLREALQVADHAAYHIAEIVIIRRLLDSWKS